jgi:arylsulfatase A-like enzyme
MKCGSILRQSFGHLAPPLGLALLATLLLTACGGSPQQQPNILLIVIDTIRADHLSAYGYSRPTSPHLEALAERGTLYLHANAAAPYTRPSTASILTGQYPAVHGAITHADSLSPQVPTLAELLKGAGYATAGIYRNGNVADTFGFHRGFDTYEVPDKKFFRRARKDPEQEDIRFVSQTDDSLLTEMAVPYLQQAKTAPFFLYLHLGGAHDPYTPPPSAPSFLDGPLTPTAQLFYQQPLKPYRQDQPVLRRLELGTLPLNHQTQEQMIALYDAEIAFADHQVGLILDALGSSPQGDNTLVIVTADHGEEFWDHGGLGHGNSNYQEQLHVPLVIAGPGIKRRRIAEPISLIDLMPTVLEIAGVEPPPGLPGRSLARVMRSSHRKPAILPVYAEGLRRVLDNGEAVFYRSLQEGDSKLILDFRKHRKELFDLSQDPKEQENLIHGEAKPAQNILDHLLATHAANLDSPFLAPVAAVEIPQELDTNLRALGYLGSSKDTVATSSLFRRPLKRFDLDAHGFVGHELEGSQYLPELNFSTSAFPAEQLLYGWGKTNQKPHRRMAENAAARLKRSPDHATWRLEGTLVGISGSAASVLLEIQVDGQEPQSFQLGTQGRFEVEGPLPQTKGPFVRFDLHCQIDLPPGTMHRRDGQAPCAAITSLRLEP